MTRPAVALALAALALLPACADPEWLRPPPRDGLVEAHLGGRDPLAAGVAAWRQHCRICHGEEGRGDGFNAELLASKPPSADAIVARLPGERLEAAIRDGARAGGRSPQCPPWGAVLGPAGVQDAAAWLRHLAGSAGASAPAPAAAGGAGPATTGGRSERQRRPSG